ncbi:hypothetical protein LIA77_08768 [Sarocladium implicatum]|nr:hypothetical protein LIA77_08768 [Sarocladium implicatum]
MPILVLIPSQQLGHYYFALALDKDEVQNRSQGLRSIDEFLPGQEVGRPQVRYTPTQSTFPTALQGAFPAHRQQQVYPMYLPHIQPDQGPLFRNTGPRTCSGAEVHCLKGLETVRWCARVVQKEAGRGNPSRSALP